MLKILLNFILQNEPGRLGHGIIVTYSWEAKPIKYLELHYILIIIHLPFMHIINQMAEFAANTTSLLSEKKLMFVGRSTTFTSLATPNYGKFNIGFEGAIFSLE